MELLLDLDNEEFEMLRADFKANRYVLSRVQLVGSIFEKMPMVVLRWLPATVPKTSPTDIALMVIK